MTWLTQWSAIFVAILLSVYVTMDAKKENDLKKPNEYPLVEIGQTEPIANYVKDELIAVAQDEAEAQEIAALYGVEIKSVADGVAVFGLTQGQDVMELVELGKQNGWPLVQPNYIYTLFDEM